MRTMMRSWGAAWLALGGALTACGGDGGGGKTPPVEQDAEVRQIEDVGPAADGETTADTGDPRDAGRTDADNRDDASLVREVTSCEQACQVYSDCGRLDVWGGSLEPCRAACEAGAGPRLPDFFSCVAVTSCAAIQECEPPPPPPPTCAEACDALFACEGGAALGLPFADSAACQAQVCASDAQRSSDLLRCGEAHLLDGACAVRDFGLCLGEAFYDDCFTACAAEAACAGDSTVATPWACAVACDEATRSGDPLQRNRDERRRDCVVAAAGDCDALGRCGAPAVRPIVGEATIEALCAANADCPVFAGETCAATAAELLPDLADGAIDCLVAHMTQTCDAGELYRCFAPAPAPEGGCEAHCLVGQLCGTLAPGETEGACFDACRETLAAGGGAAAELQASFRCDAEATCADVQTCRDAGGPIDLCRGACARQTQCGAANDLQACENACVAGFGTARRDAERLCGQVVECGQIDGCLPPAAPPCDALCGLLDACDLAGDDCVTACDDADFVDPTAFDARLACDASTARCGARRVCEGGDLSGGDACVAYCRARLECNGDTSAASQRACLLECGAGPLGADGLTFAGAAECLVTAGPDAACDALQGCLNAATTEGVCDQVCDAQTACGASFDGDPTACVTACAEDLATADGASNAACTLNALRRGEGCRAVLTCNGLPVESPSADCGALCAAQASCDDALDPYLCEVQCDADPAGDAVRAACARRVACDRLAVCVDASGEVPAACGEGCDAVEPCGAFGADGIAADAAACAAECAATALLDGAEAGDALGACLLMSAEACTPEAAARCFSAINADPICVESYDALVSCGIADFVQGDRDQYYADCMMNLANDDAGTRMSAQCIIDTAAAANGDMFACFGVIACFPGLGM